MKNIYYNPEAFGLQIIGDVDVADSYEFDMLVVFKDTETNKLYYATDSGCSCPTPFEDHRKEDLTEITRENLKQFESLCFNHRPYSYNRSLKDQILWHDDSLVLFKKVFDLV